MKIKCDVCEKEEASVFCSADEAALCVGCDRRVHHANKLAKKHHRFSLVHPSSKDFPRCDICQERKALVFCQEDRALVCRECDIPIHKANIHTQNHNRFLLTGIKLSSASSQVQTCSSSSSSSTAVTKTKNGMRKNINSSSNEVVTPCSESTSNYILYSGVESTLQQEEDVAGGGAGGSVSTSSISEYLMETLPGWHVEDFLDPPNSSFSPYAFCKMDEEMLSPFTAVDAKESSDFSVQEMANIWDLQHLQNGGEGSVELIKDFMEVVSNKKRNRRDDVMVPRMEFDPPFF